MLYWTIGAVLATGITAFILGAVTGFALGKANAIEEMQEA